MTKILKITLLSLISFNAALADNTAANMPVNTGANTAANAGGNEYNFSYNLDDASEASCNDLSDPFEPFNRKIFWINGALDRVITQPLAVAYDRLTNSFVKARVGGFVDNVYEPLTAVNYLLQGNPKYTVHSIAKFVLNSTLGLGGMFDIASRKGLTHKPQSFGSTLARYGVQSGPYIVLPLLGSTNMRDMWDGVVFDDALNPLKYGFKRKPKNVYTGIRVVQKRQEILPFTDYITRTSSDPYVSIRTAYHQSRESNLSYPASYKCGIKPKKAEKAGK